MTRGVNYIDMVLIPVNGCVLREYGNAPFFLQVIGVHNPLHITEAFPQSTRLLQQLINQGGLAMIYMSDDGNIAEFSNHDVLFPWALAKSGEL
jgi:hypothetical protein